MRKQGKVVFEAHQTKRSGPVFPIWGECLMSFATKNNSGLGLMEAFTMTLKMLKPLNKSCLSWINTVLGPNTKSDWGETGCNLSAKHKQEGY